MAGGSRFNAGGSFDDSFGIAGGVYLPHSVTTAGPVILTPDGDVLVAGVNDPPDGVGRAFSLTRLSGHVGIAPPTATLEAGDATVPRQRSATIRVTYASPA